MKDLAKKIIIAGPKLLSSRICLMKHTLVITCMMNLRHLIFVSDTGLPSSFVLNEDCGTFFKWCFHFYIICFCLYILFLIIQKTLTSTNIINSFSIPRATKEEHFQFAM